MGGPQAEALEGGKGGGGCTSHVEEPRPPWGPPLSAALEVGGNVWVPRLGECTNKMGVIQHPGECTNKMGAAKTHTGESERTGKGPGAHIDAGPRSKERGPGRAREGVAAAGRRYVDDERVHNLNDIAGIERPALHQGGGAC